MSCASSAGTCARGREATDRLEAISMRAPPEGSLGRPVGTDPLLKRVRREKEAWLKLDTDHDLVAFAEPRRERFPQGSENARTGAEGKRARFARGRTRSV